MSKMYLKVVWKVGWCAKGFLVFKYASMKICEYACMVVSKYESMEVCKYASMQVCKYTIMYIMHIFMCACMKLHRYASRYANM